MITNHFHHFPCDVDWHSIVDDFGDVVRPFESLTSKTNAAWSNAYRFANGQTFEQAGMRSIGCLVAEH